MKIQRRAAMNRKYILAALIALAVVVLATVKLVRSADAKQVETQKVTYRVLSPSILASGTLTYQSEVKLESEVIGRVTQILAQEGQVVREGQLLLRLDPATLPAEIDQLKAARRQSELNIERQKLTLNTLTAKWRRYEALRAQGSVDASTYEEVASQRDLAQVELNTSYAMLKQTEAQLAQARERQAKTEIRSPITGKVTAVFIKVGETAVPSAVSIAGSDLMTIADTGGLYAEVNVDETDVARIGAGQEAKLVAAAFPDKFWIGKVEQVAISPRQSPGQSKSYPVRIRLEENSQLQFHPGMSCRAEISTRAADAQQSLAVPVQAVKYEEPENKNDRAKASVFIVKSGRAERRDVETGVADDAYIAIVRGVSEGEEVVTGPARTLRSLRDGERIATVVADAVTQPEATQSAARNNGWGDTGS